jgi:hypothetical protein
MQLLAANFIYFLLFLRYLNKGMVPAEERRRHRGVMIFITE